MTVAEVVNSADTIYSAAIVGGSVIVHAIVTSPLWKRDIAPVLATDLVKVEKVTAPVVTAVKKDDPSLIVALQQQVDILTNMITQAEGTKNA